MASYECHCGLSAQEKYGGREALFPYPEREWPSKTLQQAPVLFSCDLRDGNQSLANPMTFEQKLEMFLLLVSIGFREIEVGFPTANHAEFAFVRYLVETPGLIPDDVWIQVLTPCREDAIRTTVDSVRGARKAMIFTYLPSGEFSQQTILGLSDPEWIEQARRGTQYIRTLTKDVASSAQVPTCWRFGFGFEDFGSARLDVVVRCADAVTEAWNPTEEDWMYLGVASSVEVSMPNVFADRVERFSRGIARRNCVRVAVHAHNDRGTAVAAAELACLAGAQRVEGCLFGNGERAGNLELVTFALNLLARGIDPQLDLRHLNGIRAQCERLTNIPVHVRAPYAGEYYFRAFSGGHQDAIRKGLYRRTASASSVNNGCWPQWRIPYLPIDPADVGRSIHSVMGITSQSGKAGVAMAIQLGLELDIPIELARAFSRRVKQRSLDRARELSIEETCAYFLTTFHVMEAVTMAATTTDAASVSAAVHEARSRGTFTSCHSVSNTSTIWNRWAVQLKPPEGTTPLIATYIRVLHEAQGEVWGVGIGSDEERAKMSAVCSVVLSTSSFCRAS